MDFSLITGALASLTSAKQLADAALDVRDFNQAASAITQINQQLLEAQQRLFAHNAALLVLQQQHFEAINELRELREALAERGRYSLHELSKGVFVYRPDASPEPTDTGGQASAAPEYYLCQPCFDKGTKSVLQALKKYGHLTLTCTACTTEFPTGQHVPAPQFRSRVHGPSW